jgi:hypothetical protein
MIMEQTGLTGDDSLNYLADDWRTRDEHKKIMMVK